MLTLPLRRALYVRQPAGVTTVKLSFVEMAAPAAAAAGSHAGRTGLVRLGNYRCIAGPGYDNRQRMRQHMVDIATSGCHRAGLLSSQGHSFHLQ